MWVHKIKLVLLRGYRIGYSLRVISHKTLVHSFFFCPRTTSLHFAKLDQPDHTTGVNRKCHLYMLERRCNSRLWNMAVKHVGQTQPKKTLGFLIKLIAGYHEHPRLSSLIGQVSSFYKIVCHSLSHREIGSRWMLMLDALLMLSSDTTLAV